MSFLGNKEKNIKEQNNINIKENMEVSENDNKILEGISSIDGKVNSILDSISTMDRNYKKFLMMTTDRLEDENKRVKKEIINILDVFYDTLLFIAEDEKYRKGIESAIKKINAILEKIGIEEIDSTIGNDFNPNFHNAKNYADSENCSIKSVIRRGYKEIGSETIIRYAEVEIKRKEL